jgi:endonuclease YncB( thermonuclease family)
MAKSRTLPAALAAFALVLAAGLAVTFASGNPALARAEQVKVASNDAPRHLRGRSGSVEQRLRVIDGDTLEDMGDDITYRLVNIDTPETGPRARCDAERSLGDRATEAARSLIAHARQLEFRPTGRIDRYGRTIAFVLIDGRDMGETLIAEGFARPWRGRREPWCDSNGNLIP